MKMKLKQTLLFHQSLKNKKQKHTPISIHIGTNLRSTMADLMILFSHGLQKFESHKTNTENTLLFLKQKTYKCLNNFF